jgi:hypothetical protein
MINKIKSKSIAAYEYLFGDRGIEGNNGGDEIVKTKNITTTIWYNNVQHIGISKFNV